MNNARRTLEIKVASAILCKVGLTRTTWRTEVTFPCRTTTWCTNRFPDKKTVPSPSTKVALNRHWVKWRMTHLSLCGMMKNATIPLVDRTLPQLKTPQITHDASATITFFNHQNVERQWKSRSYTSSKSGCVLPNWTQRESNEPFTLFWTKIFSMRNSWTMPEEHWRWDQPQRCRAKSPNQPQRFMLVATLVQVIGLQLKRKDWILHVQSKIIRN